MNRLGFAHNDLRRPPSYSLLPISSLMYDAVIIGAGINGCGIALELSKRGHRVVVVDKGPIGGGTSSKSTRLIHGGLRYLEQLHFGLVREALQDRSELLRTYPDLVQLKPFYFPVYEESPRPAWMIGIGVRLYDWLAGRQLDQRSFRTTAAEFGAAFPSVRTEALKAVFCFYDGKTDDLALTRRVAEDARGLGSEIHEQTTIESITWRGATAVLATSVGTIEAGIVINATGPWIDEVNGVFDLPARYSIRRVSGIHLFFDGLLTPHPLFLQTASRRIFFLIPEPETGRTMVGTTEREESVPSDEVSVTEADVDYLIGAVNEYLRPDYALTRAGVRETTIGIRPLVTSREDATDLSREYQLDLHQLDDAKLLHVFGGKLTTYLSLSRKAADLLGL